MKRWLRRAWRVVHTTAMRQAVSGALLQVMVWVLALGGVYILMQQRLDTLAGEQAKQEIQQLAALPLTKIEQVLAAGRSASDGFGVRHALLLDAQGRVLAGNVLHWPPEVPADGRVRRAALLVRDDDNDHEQLGRLRVVATTLPQGERLLLAYEPGVLDALSESVWSTVLLAVLLSALIALGLGLRLGWQWLQRVEAINATAGRIARGELHARVQRSPRGDEFDLLADHLNAMLARIEQAVNGMREVSDHLAHDLRKPLTRLKNQLAALMDEMPPQNALHAQLSQMDAELDALIHTFEAMLSIARLEAGSEFTERERIDLAHSLHGVLALYQDQAEDAGRVMRIHLPPNLWVMGHAALLQRALANLLDNALLYTPKHSPIDVLARCEGASIVLECVDHGTGICEEDRARMLQKFTRGDAARSLPGTGLGLPLARAVARAHGGELSLHPTPGGGLTVRMTLPAAE